MLDQNLAGFWSCAEVAVVRMYSSDSLTQMRYWEA
jgi:hypothetical protein